MKLFYFLMLPALMCLILYACGTKSDAKPANAQQSLLLGKWNLQKENTVVYVDGVKQSETERDASNTGFSYLEFNADNKYSSISYYNSGGVGSISLTNIIAVDTVKGSYNFSDAAFSLSTPGLAGLEIPSVTGATGPVPLFQLVSQSEQVMKLTASALTLHVEYTTTQTIATDTKTYKNVLDYYYTR